MPKEKVNIAPIKNRDSLQVTHCKRCKGLMKKAKELVVMCGAQVGAIVFSAASKLKVFPKPDSGYQFENLNNIIRKWETHPDVIGSPGESSASNSEVNKEYYEELKAKRSAERQIISQMTGEDIDNLSLEELEKLEEKMQESLTAVKQKRRSTRRHRR